MTAKEVTSMALELLSRVGQTGSVDETRQSRYYGIAPAYLTLMQYEIASLMNLSAVGMKVTDITAALKIDDDTAARVMPAGLAMYFALTDGDAACYDHFAKLYYNSLLPSLKPDESGIVDYYGVAGDPTMR